MRSEKPASRRGQGAGRVRQLPDALVDQIAAGEVVERPASVLKELIENALDAGADRLEVEIRGGGGALIAVSDDGVGMAPDEVRMALRRHATSKISTQDDLEAILTFGFRGEALPAIAAVSRMRIRSRPKNSEIGFEVEVEASEVKEERALGCPAGTRIEVADLFGNVPARRKFLKTATTEWGHSIDWLGRLAMGLPEIHFEIRRDDRDALIWPATGDPLERIAAVLGESQTRGLLHIEWEEEAGHLDAYVSGPDLSRANGKSIYLYVNGRPVRDKLLRHAVTHAYRDLLPRGRFPVALLSLSVRPETVDVNVHPAKWEVRFENPQSIHQLVRHAVREAMSGREYLGARDSVAKPSSSRSTVGRTASEPARDPSPESRSDWLFARGRALGNDLLRDAPPPPDPEERDELGGRVLFSELRLVGQLLARYLVVEGEKGMLLVDQHAAHERVLYERLRSAWLAGGVDMQGLLASETVEVGATAVAALAAAAESIRGLGFDLEGFGDASVLVRAIPALLSGQNPGNLVRDLADELEDGELAQAGDESNARWLVSADRILATLACHSARRFGDQLPDAEQRAILRGLDGIPWAPTCPHGRPVVVQLEISELDRRFGRDGPRAGC